ncbi:MAG: hypothetical protein HWE16_19110 [Gammaproteobacteria bacterium]|nr:hypothetical protein [Gammaproteobacteria bacterium]
MYIELTHQMTFFSYYSFMLERMPHILREKDASLWIKIFIGNPITLFFICVYFSYKKGDFIFKSLDIRISNEQVVIDVVDKEIKFTWEECAGFEELKKLFLIKFKNGDVPVPKNKLTASEKQTLLAHLGSLQLLNV